MRFWLKQSSAPPCRHGSSRSATVMHYRCSNSHLTRSRAESDFLAPTRSMERRRPQILEPIWHQSLKNESQPRIYLMKPSEFVNSLHSGDPIALFLVFATNSICGFLMTNCLEKHQWRNHFLFFLHPAGPWMSRWCSEGTQLISLAGKQFLSSLQVCNCKQYNIVFNPEGPEFGATNA